MLPSVSVTNLDTFRWWQGEEGLDLDWLLARLRGEEETEAMRVGKAFHAALEEADGGEIESLITSDYRFDFNCDCELPVSHIREASVEADYGGLLVRGRVDALDGKTVTDFKVTERFDPDRFFEGYQWRYYLDMTGCDKFIWRVFVIREFGGPGSYEVYQTHTLSQNRYPGLREDCAKLAREYLRFWNENECVRNIVRQRKEALAQKSAT